MSPIKARLKGMWQSRGWRRAAKAVGIAGGVFLFETLSGHLLVEQLFDPAWGWFKTRASEPAGTLWVWLAITILALLSLAVLETSPLAAAAVRRLRSWRKRSPGPVPSPPPPAPLRLSLEEAEMILPARVLWRDSGAHVGQVYSLLERLREALGEKHVWPRLLTQPLTVLAKASEDISIALSDSSVAPHVEVVDKLDRFLNAYMQVTRWISACFDEVATGSLEEPLQRRRDRWEKEHAEFAERVRILSIRPEYAALRSRVTNELYNLRH